MRLQPLTDEALSERAFQALKEAIITMQLRPGERLIERQIALQLGISTTPVRHAIHQLANEGLVTIALNRTAIVRELAPADIDELYAVRELLEPAALRQAYERQGAALLANMDAILLDSSRADGAADYVALADCNRRFNVAIVAGCTNGRLRTILDSLHSQTRQIAAIARGYRQSPPRDHQEHVRIVAALRGGSWPEVEAAVVEHLRGSRTEVLLAFERYQAEQRTADETDIESVARTAG
ncbi:MAG: GntR family transcriptional regulator [Thermomicrobiales bacterium]